MNNAETITMTAETIGRNLLEALVLECKMLPDVWPKLSKTKQDDVIERLRQRVIRNVAQAVHMIASDGRAVAEGVLKKVVFKDGITAEFVVSKNCPTRHQLADAEGKLCLIVVANAEDHMGEIAAVRGEEDQRAMDLGHEYDPKGDGKGMEAGDIVDSTWRLTDSPLQADLDAAYLAGANAASQGDPKDACPVMSHELVARWTAGWHEWHEKNDSSVDPASAETDPLYDQAVAVVLAEQRCSISQIQRHMRIGYNRAARLVEQMEAAGIVSAMDEVGARTVLKSDEGATA